MRILSMSDTHGDLKTVRNILQEHAAVDLKIHLGDVGLPLRGIGECTIAKGNHDCTQRLPKEVKLTLEERKVACLHGDIFDDEIVQEVLVMYHVPNGEITGLCMYCLLYTPPSP